MSPEREELVRVSWRKFGPVSRRWAGFFYDRLFELHPASQALFRNTDMDAQGQKLMQMLDAIVEALAHPERLVVDVAALGRRHATYGVRDEDYQSVGTALIWTLEEALGPEFTPEARSAWSEAYLLLAEIMRRAARTSTGEVPGLPAPESPDLPEVQ
jgi:hemoglobin-like flavoprotein